MKITTRLARPRETDEIDLESQIEFTPDEARAVELSHCFNLNDKLRRIDDHTMLLTTHFERRTLRHGLAVLREELTDQANMTPRQRDQIAIKDAVANLRDHDLDDLRTFLLNGKPDAAPVNTDPADKPAPRSPTAEEAREYLEDLLIAAL